MPSRRHSSEMFSSPRSPSSTMRIFSSAEYCRRVWRRMSFSTCSAGALPGPDFCFIFAPHGYDEPEILHSWRTTIRLLGADGEQSGDVPAVDLDSPKIDVGDKRSIFSFGCVEQLQSIFAGRSYYYLKSAVGKAFFDDALNKLIVLNDQNNWLFFHPTLPGRAAQKPP